MNDFYAALIELLKKNDNYFSKDGQLLRNSVYEAAMKNDTELLRLLLSDAGMRNKFFTNVDGVLVFDKVKFGWIINNRQFLPDNYTRYKKRIGLIDENDNESYIKESNSVVLSFPYKDCLLEFDSTDVNEKREEVYFNAILASDEIDRLKYPKVLVNATRCVDGKDIPTDTFKDDDNLIIKGNNLLALYSLLPRYEGKIKCMYWDILYNTDNDIVPYNDSFKHSSWLVMMKNRLDVAKRLMARDSVIVIECDKNEDSYLKVLCDEIFDRDNFVNSITVQSSTPSGTKLAHRDRTILKTKDTLLVYKKGELKIKPQYCEASAITNFSYWLDKTDDGVYKISNLKDILVSRGLMLKNESINDLKINRNPDLETFIIENASHIFRKQPSMPDDVKKASKKEPDRIIEYEDGGVNHLCQNGYRFAFLSTSVREINGSKKLSQLVCDIWTDISFHGTQYEGNVDLPAGKKPERLIRRIIDMFMNPGDIILDAYLGSGTTCAVAQKMGMHYIGIEQLDEHFNKSISRLKYVVSGQDNGPVSNELGYKGGGSFVYCELAKLNQTFIEEISKADSYKELLDIRNRIIDTGFISCKVNASLLKTDDAEFLDLPIDKQKEFLFELLDKNLLYINYCDVTDMDFNVEPRDIAFSNSFYEEA